MNDEPQPPNTRAWLNRVCRWLDETELPVLIPEDVVPPEHSGQQAQNFAFEHQALVSDECVGLTQNAVVRIVNNVIDKYYGNGEDEPQICSALTKIRFAYISDAIGSRVVVTLLTPWPELAEWQVVIRQVIRRYMRLKSLHQICEIGCVRVDHDSTELPICEFVEDVSLQPPTPDEGELHEVDAEIYSESLRPWLRETVKNVCLRDPVEFRGIRFLPRAGDRFAAVCVLVSSDLPKNVWEKHLGVGLARILCHNDLSLSIKIINVAADMTSVDDIDDFDFDCEDERRQRAW